MTTKEPNPSRRWNEELIHQGDWIQLPKVLIERSGSLGLKPQHVWLVLFLQCSRFKNRHPRFYWAEIAKAAGKTVSTVRKWAYELRDMGLLTFGPGFEKDRNKKRPPAPKLGYRNDRNVFYLRKLEDRLVDELAKREGEKQARRSGGA